jgi:hypothetical protein
MNQHEWQILEKRSGADGEMLTLAGIGQALPQAVQDLLLRVWSVPNAMVPGWFFTTMLCLGEVCG